MAEGSGSGVLRLLSGQRTIDALFAAHPRRMSRAGIARVSGLSKPTVSALMADMESAGLVRVADESPLSGSIGRPAALYELVPAARHSVVADIGATKILVGVCDLFGNLVAERELETGPRRPGCTGASHRCGVGDAPRHRRSVPRSVRRRARHLPARQRSRRAGVQSSGLRQLGAACLSRRAVRRPCPRGERRQPGRARRTDRAGRRPVRRGTSRPSPSARASAWGWWWAETSTGVAPGRQASWAPCC